MARMPRLALAAALTTLALSGCDSSEAPREEQPAAQAIPAPSFETPRAAFDSAIAAARREDWKTFATCLTPEGQDGMIGMAMLVASMMFSMDAANPAKKDLDALLARHGAGGLDSPDRDAALGNVRDKPALVADLFAFLSARVGGSSSAPFVGDLHDLVEDGDLAVGKVQNSDGMRSDVSFRRIDGAWKVEFEVAMR